MLTDQEKEMLLQAFNAAIKSSSDAIAAASVLIPLLQKIVASKPEQPLQLVEPVGDSPDSPLSGISSVRRRKNQH